MRGLTIVVAAADRTRFRSALGLAAAQAALGGRTRLFLDGPAVVLMRMRDTDAADDDDVRHAAAGLPTVAELIDTCVALGVTISLCQSGMALAGVNLAALGAPVTAGGLTVLLADLGEDRLVVI